MSNRVDIVYDRLVQEYPDVRCTLDYVDGPQFLFANILSPQCTDIVANQVSRDLHKAFPTLDAIVQAGEVDIQEVIRPCGMYRVKSRHIKGSARLLLRRYGGELPQTMGELVKFPGIGRKTALVILQEVFDIVEGIIIDTHNIRIAHLIGFTSEKSADKIERDLMEIVPRKYWKLWSHLMVHHGRAVCIARNPKCSECVICDVCEFGSGRNE